MRCYKNPVRVSPDRPDLRDLYLSGKCFYPEVMRIAPDKLAVTYIQIDPSKDYNLDTLRIIAREGAMYMEGTEDGI